MVSTFTTSKHLEKPANGDFVDTWSTPVNADWDAIDNAFSGSATVNVVAATGTVALTLNQYQPLIIAFSGLLTASVNYQLPAGVGGHWLMFNNTTGAFTVTISNANAGSSVLLPQGKTAIVVCDGTNVVFPNAPVAPGGSNTQLQYNASGLLAGASNLLFNGSTALAIGTTGIPITATITGAVIVAGTTSGGSTFAVPAAAATISYILPVAQGSANQLLANDGAGNLSWSTVAAGVTSVSFGTTGLTPSSPTGGAVVVAGTLATANGGTALTTFTAANRAIYSTSASVLTAGTLPIAAGGTNATTASITSFNNITGLSAAGTTGTTSTNIVFSTSPTLTTPTISSAALASTMLDNVGNPYGIGWRGMPKRAVSTAQVLAQTDNGTQIESVTGGLTINTGLSSDFSAVFYNNSGSNQAITAGGGLTLQWISHAGSTGSRVLLPNGYAFIDGSATASTMKIGGNLT